jgi:hypothetical protein
MRSLFADTFYWIALLNRREVWYSRVVAQSRTLGIRRLNYGVGASRVSGVL